MSNEKATTRLTDKAAEEIGFDLKNTKPGLAGFGGLFRQHTQDLFNERDELIREVGRLREALARTATLASLLTVRQVVNAGDTYIDAAGLNPWCINEGLATGDEQISVDFARAVLSVKGEGG